MPDRTATVVSYAAGASLAAVALIYVFGPTFTIDHQSTGHGRSKTIVGLRNQANDCFLNSVLQALAGLGHLRIYLIRETHRRRIDDAAVYANLVQPAGTPPLELWKLEGLQDGLVTFGLKDMLDALNERPICKKSISSYPFVRVLEAAFRQRISRQQQDAQEFLQIVVDRLKDEYDAGLRARLHARRSSSVPAKAQAADDVQAAGSDAHSQTDMSLSGLAESLPVPPSTETDLAATDPLAALEEGFPMEGGYESSFVCQTCHYKTKPREERFCTLTLAVPHVSSTTLNACFDGIFKVEYIDDFKCEMCRLVQAKSNLELELLKSTSEPSRVQAREAIGRLRLAMETDPEKVAEGVDLGDIRDAPKRRIAKTTRMTRFPKILAIHLSRSIYGADQQTSQKNSAKVAFPERLWLGGLADQRRYKLLAIITHKGGHHSGHYEAFRRQNQPSPYHNANTFQPSDVYSKSSPQASTPASTPELKSVAATSTLTSGPMPSETGADEGDAGSVRSAAPSSRTVLSRRASSRLASTDDSSAKAGVGNKKAEGRASTSSPVRRGRLGGGGGGSSRWWRVSDEKVREAKTSEVLALQREVYLLFYELEQEA